MVPFLTAVLLTLPSRGAAQKSYTEGRIGAVEIRNHSVFNPESLPPEGGLSWTYRLANALHIRTTAAFIESALFFREGDCLDPVARGPGPSGPLVPRLHDHVGSTASSFEGGHISARDETVLAKHPSARAHGVRSPERERNRKSEMRIGYDGVAREGGGW